MRSAFTFMTTSSRSTTDSGRVGAAAGSVNARGTVPRAVSEPPQDLTAFVAEAMPFGPTLGIESIVGDAEEVVATLAWAPELCTAGGALHGGVLMALADSAGGVCAFLNLPSGATTVTIESKTNFFGAVREGTVRARSRPLHRGRTTIVVETDLLDASDRRVGRTTQTQAILGPD